MKEGVLKEEELSREITPFALAVFLFLLVILVWYLALVGSSLFGREDEGESIQGIYDKVSVIRASVNVKEGALSAGVNGVGLIDGLESSDFRIKHATLIELQELKELPKSFIPRLLPLLNDQSRFVREGTLEVLSRYRELPAKAVPLVSQLLKDPEPEVRETAARVIGRVAPIADKFKPLLFDALKDKNAGVYRSVGDTLLLLISGDQSYREILLRGLKSEFSGQQLFSVKALRKIEEGRTEIAREIGPLLEGSDRELVLEAIQTLNGYGSHAKPALPYLFKLLGSPSLEIQANASIALGKIGSSEGRFAYQEYVRSITPLIIKHYQHPDPLFRAKMKELVFNLGEVAYTSLLGSLNHKNSKIRKVTSDLLSEFGPGFTRAYALPIAEAYQFKKPEVVIYLNRFLGGKGIYEKALPTIGKGLSSPHAKGREASLLLLGFAGEDANAFVPKIVWLLQDDSLSVRLAAIDSLSKIVKEEGVIGLTTQVNNPSIDIREATYRAFHRIASLDPVWRERLLPYFISGLRDRSWQVRALSAKAMQEYRGTALRGRVVKVLNHAIKDPHYIVRGYALSVQKSFNIK